MISLASQAEARNLTVVAQPQVLDRGQYLQVSVAVTNPIGSSVVAGRIYMEIVDSKGFVVWPLSVVAQNTSEFTKLISTAELKPNTRYWIRVSTNNKLIHQAYSEFKTTRTIIPAFIPLATTVGLLIPNEVQDYNFRIYRTELDKRVCPICKRYEGMKWAKDDPTFVRIGPPELGGETHFGCRCHYDLIDVPFNAALRKAQSIVQTVNIFTPLKKHKRKRDWNRT